MEKNNKIAVVACILSAVALVAIVVVTMHFYKYHDSVAAMEYEGVKWSGSADVHVPADANLAGEVMPIDRVDVREALTRELITNTYLHSHTIQLIKKAPRYFSIIEPILAEMGIPDDFKYLAVIESQLNPLAVSHAGAVGLWQFMKGTAEDFDLEVTSEVDQRYNIEKSTYAACRYLKQAYERFGSWTLAAASYNAGMRRVTLQQQDQKRTSFYDLLFVEETTRYIYRFVALKEIISNPKAYNFYIDEPYLIESTKEVVVNGEVADFVEFADSYGISYKSLKRFNPWLRKDHLKNKKNKTYKVLVPTNPELY